MDSMQFKTKQSDFQWLIKQFKVHAGEQEKLRHYVPTLLRAIRLSTKASDVAWRAEGLHQLALFHMRDGDFVLAEDYFIESLCNFQEDEPLGACRSMRDYALLYATCGESGYALFIARETLTLHDKDLALLDGLDDDDPKTAEAEAKAERQQRITQSYIWHLKLEGTLTDIETLEKLVEFAMTECDDCCLRDQEQIIGFALAHAPSGYRQMLRLRLGILYAQRKQPVAFTANLIRFGLDIPRFTTGLAYRTLFRRE